MRTSPNEPSVSRSTVLLLDALDEDSSAWGRIDERLSELLDAAKNFRQLILTCRTQFFPKGGKAAIEKPWKIEVSGYICNLIYLSPFSDEQVEEYLCNVFPAGWRERLPKWILKQNEPVQRRRARRAVRTMNSLRMRPMLLAHIHDLMDEDADQWTEYRIYQTLVERWLLREERKQKGKVTREELWEVCTAIALGLQAAGKRELALGELDEIVGKEPLAERLIAFDFGGRSLLNRTSEQGFRFAHYSIQEFLIAHLLVSSEIPDIESRVRATNQLISFLLEWVREAPSERIRKVPWGTLNFRDIKIDLLEILQFARGDLRGFELRGVPFRSAHLQNLDFRDADLRDADFREANLSFACFARANLTGARFDSAVTVGTGFLGAHGLSANLHRSAGPSKPKVLRAMLGQKISISVVAWRPDRHLFATDYRDKTIKIWNTAGNLLQTLEGHEDHVYSIMWDPSGERIASGSYDSTVKIWDAVEGRLLRTLEGHKGHVYSLTWDSSGDHLVSGSLDSTVRLWNAASGRLLQTLEDHKSAVYSVAWDPSGGRLASGSHDQTIKIWPVPSGRSVKTPNRLFQTLEGHKGTVCSLAWDPSGDRLASGSHDMTTKIWTASGHLHQDLVGHESLVDSVAWDPSGDRLASSSSDMTIKIWDASSGRLLQTLEDHKNSVRSVAWDPSGDRLASGSSDNTVKIWDATSGLLIKTLVGNAGEVLFADGWALYKPADVPEAVRRTLLSTSREDEG
jgi:WD40 repeat protein